MKNHTLLFKNTVFLLLSVCSIFLAGCFTQQHPENATSVKTNTVHMAHHMYAPEKIVIAKGEKVTWINNDWVSHTVTSQSFASGNMSPGQVFTHVFNKPGVYNYYCNYHPNMKGMVVVH